MIASDFQILCKVKEKESHKNGKRRKNYANRIKQTVLYKLYNFNENFITTYGVLPNIHSGIVQKQVTMDDGLLPVDRKHSCFRSIVRRKNISSAPTQECVGSAIPTKFCGWKEYFYPNVVKKHRFG